MSFSGSGVGGNLEGLSSLCLAILKPQPGHRSINRPLESSLIPLKFPSPKLAVRYGSIRPMQGDQLLFLWELCARLSIRMLPTMILGNLPLKSLSTNSPQMSRRPF